MTHATALRIALPCALLSLTMACTGANTKPDTQLAEDVEPAPPEDVATPEAPPSFCEDPEAREMTVREYRWCARGEVPHGRYVAERGGVTLLEGQFVEGVMEGEWLGYHANGSKKWRGTFAGGKESGEFVAWREDGTKHYSVAFTEGVHEGPTVYFHPTGEKSSEVTFANNAPNGTWSYFHDNGQMAHRLSWREDGKETIHEHWTTDGDKTNSPEGRLPKSAVERVAGGIDPQIIDCYKHMRAFERAEGKIVVQFTIDYSGDVNRVSVLADDFPNTFMRQCAQRAVEALSFPANPYGPQRVIRTWTLGVQ